MKRRPANRGKKCKRFKLVPSKALRKKVKRCASFGLKKKGVRRRLKGRTRSCKFGVSKTTGKCLKNRRRRR